jgi:predicted secreted hydrolase
MRFLLEIIFCIGAAYGIAWLFANYGSYVSQPLRGLDWMKVEKENAGTLAFFRRHEEKHLRMAERADTVRPIRDRRWLS